MDQLVPKSVISLIHVTSAISNLIINIANYNKLLSVNYNTYYYYINYSQFYFILTWRYGLAADRTRRCARNRWPPGQHRVTSANLCDNMASFRMSPTSGALPETRITSPIMLHLFIINDRSIHSRKYALPVESPWLLHLHTILRQSVGKISWQNFESS